MVASLQSCLRDGSHGLSLIPKLLTRIIRDELWREFYCEPVQEVVRHESFEAYVTDELPTGLGTTVRFLLHVCRDDSEAEDAIDKATKNDPGPPEGNHNAAKDKTTLDNIQDSKAPTGTSRQAAIRRLRKDRPDLHAEVIAGNLSAHAAMVSAGFRKKPTPDDQCVKAFLRADRREVLRRLHAEMTDEDISYLRSLLNGEA